MGVCSAWVVSGHWVPPSLRAPHHPLPLFVHRLTPPCPAGSLLTRLPGQTPPLSGCPQQLFLPSPERTGGHRGCQQEAVTFQLTAREMGAFPPQPPMQGWGLLSASCFGPQEGCGGAKEGQKGSFPKSQGSQPCPKPPLAAACLMGPSASVLTFPTVRGGLPPTLGAVVTSLPATQAMHVPPHPQLGDPGEETLSPVKWAVERIRGDQAVKCLARCLAPSKLVESVPLWAAASSLPIPSLQ